MKDPKSICFTGKLSRPRKELIEIAKEHGFTVKGSVTNDLGHLVYPDDDWRSTKVYEARRRGVNMILESQFWEMVELDELKNLMHMK